MSISRVRPALIAALILAVSLYAATAFGTQPNPENCDENGNPLPNDSQAQGQGQGQAQKQGQHQSQTAKAAATAASSSASDANANNEGVDQNVELNQEYRQVRQVASAFAGGTNTTAACRYSVGAGAQSGIAGLSFGFGRKDKDCERLGLAQDLYARGQKIAGDRVYCTITTIKSVLGEDCLALINEVQAIKVEQSTVISREQEIERRKARTGFDKVQK